MTTRLPEAAARARPAAPALAPGSIAARIRAHALLIVLSLVAILPLYWMLVTALRAPNDIFSASPWPERPTLQNFAAILRDVPILRMIGNTFVVATLTALVQLVTAVLAAYAFARWRTRASKALFALLTVTWLIPAQVVMVPGYLIVTGFGMLDSLAALIIPHAASAFAIIILYQSLRAFPQELIEAAVIDGAGHLRILRSVMLPNLRPALASLAILIFISSWNDYFWPLLVTRSQENAVVQIGLQMFFTQEGNQWGPLMAASTLASLPILALYVALQRQIIDSFVRSGIK